MDNNPSEVGFSVFVNKLVQIGFSTLINPKALVWLECLLVELCHEAEAGSLVEEVKLLVVFF